MEVFVVKSCLLSCLLSEICKVYFYIYIYIYIYIYLYIYIYIYNNNIYIWYSIFLTLYFTTHLSWHDFCCFFSLKNLDPFDHYAGCCVPLSRIPFGYGYQVRATFRIEEMVHVGVYIRCTGRMDI